MNLGNYNNIFYKSRRKLNKNLNGGSYAVYLNEYKNSFSTRNSSPNQAIFRTNGNIKLPSDINSTNTYMLYPKSLQTSPNSQMNKNSIYQSPYKYVSRQKKDDFDLESEIQTTTNSDSKCQKRYYKSALDNYDNIPIKRDGNRAYQDDQKQTILLPSIVKERDGLKNNENSDSENQINIKERVDASYDFFQKILKEVRKNSEFKKELEEEFHRTSNSKRRNRTLDNYDKDFDDTILNRSSKQRDHSLSGVKSVRQSKDSSDESIRKPDYKLNSLRTPNYKYKQSRLNKTEMTEIDDFEQDQQNQKQVNFINKTQNSRNENKLDNIYLDQNIIQLNRLNDNQPGLQGNGKLKQVKNSSPNGNQLPNQIRSRDEISQDYKKLLLSKRGINIPLSSVRSSQQTSPQKASYEKKKQNIFDGFDESQIDESGQDKNSQEALNSKVFKKDLIRRYKEILAHNNLQKDEVLETKQKAFDLTHTYYSQKLSLLEKQLGRKKTENEILEYKFDESLTNYKLQTASEQSKIRQRRYSKQLGTLNNDSKNQTNEINSQINQDNTVLCQDDEDLKMEVCMMCNNKDIVQQVKDGNEVKLECQIQIKNTDLSQLRRRSSNFIDIIFVIDNVDKIMSTKYWQIIEFIKNLLRELDDKDQVCLLVQNNLSEDFEQLQELNTENRKHFLKILEKIPAVTQSSMYSLLLHAYKITQQKENKNRFSHIFVFGDCQNITVYQKVNQNLKNQLSSHAFKSTLKSSQNLSFLNSPQINYNQIEETSTISKYFCLESISNSNHVILTDDIYDFCNTQEHSDNQKNQTSTNPQKDPQNISNHKDQNFTNDQNSKNTQFNNNQQIPNNNTSDSTNKTKNDNKQNSNQGIQQANKQNSPQKTENKDQLNNIYQQNKDQNQQLSQKQNSNSHQIQQNEALNSQKTKLEQKTTKNNLSDIVEQNDEENLQSSRQNFYKNSENKEKLVQIKSFCKDILQQTLNIIQADQLLELRINPIFSDVFKITQIFNEKYTQDEENNVFIFKSKIIDKSKVKTIGFEIEVQRQLFGQIIQNSQHNIFDEHSIVQSIYAIHDQHISIKTELHLRLNNQYNSK
ncbi:hypothetical protein ABPG73_002305 [Tetrahymena malaccensis]